MPLFWLRTALLLYGLGLLHSVSALWGKRQTLARIMLPAVGLAAVFHFVSLTEGAMLNDVQTLSSTHQVESLLAFLLMAFFFVIYGRYRTASPGIAVFPLVFMMTASASSSALQPDSPSPFVSGGWIYMHVGLILVGYSALVFSFCASIMYLIQEKSLKSKEIGGFWSRLPALATIDEIGYRCLVFGFPFMTFGLIAGSVLAEARFGSGYFKDPKIVLSILMWAVYTVLLYARWSAGWRGRRAAYMSAFAFGAAILAWAANNMSSTHRFIAP